MNEKKYNEILWHEMGHGFRYAELGVPFRIQMSSTCGLCMPHRNDQDNLEPILLMAGAWGQSFISPLSFEEIWLDYNCSVDRERFLTLGLNEEEYLEKTLVWAAPYTAAIKLAVERLFYELYMSPVESNMCSPVYTPEMVLHNKSPWISGSVRGRLEELNFEWYLLREKVRKLMLTKLF